MTKIIFQRGFYNTCQQAQRNHLKIKRKGSNFKP